MGPQNSPERMQHVPPPKTIKDRVESLFGGTGHTSGTEYNSPGVKAYFAGLLSDAQRCRQEASEREALERRLRRHREIAERAAAARERLRLQCVGHPDLELAYYRIYGRWPAVEVDETEKEVKEIAGEDEMRLANQFTIGCDPEFIVAQPPGPVILTHHLRENGLIGWDHGGRVGELRPPACKGTYTLLKRLQALLADEKLTELRATHPFIAGAAYNWRGAEHPLGLGGHVHFGINYKKLSEAGKAKDFIGALDELTKCFEHLELFPSKAQAVRRASTQYGRFGDVRSDFEDGRFEYRTFPSWLYSPEVAYLALTAAKLAGCAPDILIEKLGSKKEWATLQRFFEAFRFKDDNAARAVDKVLPRLVGREQHPADDFRQRWERLAF